MKREFPDFTKEECDEAFSLYLAKKLEFKESHFGSFSSLFVGSILQSYRSYRQHNFSELNKYKNPKLNDEIPTKMAYLNKAFKPKYEKLLNGEPYGKCFSDIDGWLFYTSLEECGILKISKEERQKAWDDVRSDLSWFTVKREKMKPTKDDCIKQSKINLFKIWVQNKVDELCDFDEIASIGYV